MMRKTDVIEIKLEHNVLAYGYSWYAETTVQGKKYAVLADSCVNALKDLQRIASKDFKYFELIPE